MNNTAVFEETMKLRTMNIEKEQSTYFADTRRGMS